MHINNDNNNQLKYNITVVTHHCKGECLHDHLHLILLVHLLLILLYVYIISMCFCYFDHRRLLLMSMNTVCYLALKLSQLLKNRMDH